MVELLLREKLRLFIEEDLAFGDTTTDLIIEPKRVRAEIVSREDGVVAGMVEASELLDMCGIKVLKSRKDGSRIKADDVIMNISGVNRSILMIERTLLNLVSRMSGIATMTATFLSAARKANPEIRIAATRKTAPGLRWLDKKAVAAGGGDTHRMALHDSILIKDNHIAAVGDLATCVRRAKSKASFVRKVEVEVSTPDDAVLAAKSGADVVMLDNMTIAQMKETLTLLCDEGIRGQILVEASGKISIDDISEIASLGVDIISVGSLTHSPRSLDLTLKLVD